jgi:hypothetical protein
VQPATVKKDAALPDVRVTVQNADGPPITSPPYAISIEIAPNPSGGSLSGTRTITTSSGVATFTGLSISAAGTGYRLKATATGAATAISAPFDIVSEDRTASRLAFTVQPMAAQVGVSLTPAVEVSVLDADGKLVPDASSSIALALGAGSPSGTLSGTSTINASNGVATFPGLSINTVGRGYTLRATSGSLTAATSSSFDILPAAATVTAGKPTDLAVTGTDSPRPKFKARHNGTVDASEYLISLSGGGESWIIHGTGATTAGSLSPDLVYPRLGYRDLTWNTQYTWRILFLYTNAAGQLTGTPWSDDGTFTMVPASIPSFSETGSGPSTTGQQWRIVSVASGLPLPVPPSDSSMYPPYLNPAYNEYRNGYLPVTLLKPGSGCWAKIKNTPEDKGNPWVQSRGTAVRTFSLHIETKGWIILGNPFNQPLVWDYSITTPPAIQPYRDKSNSSVEFGSSPFIFGNAYATSDTISRFMGFWIKVSKAGDLVLRLPE